MTKKIRNPPKLSPYRPVSGAAPCKACPFRRSSAAGWLGGATPESFIVQISMDYPLPCHPTISYDEPRWLEKWEAQRTGKICAGSLVMAANMCKKPRDPTFPRLPPDRKLVFATHLEFIRHHSDAEVRSWETDESHEIRPSRKRTK